MHDVFFNDLALGHGVLIIELQQCNIAAPQFRENCQTSDMLTFSLSVTPLLQTQSTTYRPMVAVLPGDVSPPPQPK